MLILKPKLWGFLLETSSGIVLRIYLPPFSFHHCLSVYIGCSVLNLTVILQCSTTTAELNSWFFTFCHDNSHSFKMSNVGKLPWNWFLKDNIQEKKYICRRLFTSSKKRHITKLYILVVQRRQWRDVQKRLLHVRSCCLFFVAVAVALLSSFMLQSRVTAIDNWY